MTNKRFIREALGIGYTSNPARSLLECLIQQRVQGVPSSETPPQLLEKTEPQPPLRRPAADIAPAPPPTGRAPRSGPRRGGGPGPASPPPPPGPPQPPLPSQLSAPAPSPRQDDVPPPLPPRPAHSFSGHAPPKKAQSWAQPAPLSPSRADDANGRPAAAAAWEVEDVDVDDTSFVGSPRARLSLPAAAHPHPHADASARAAPAGLFAPGPAPPRPEDADFLPFAAKCRALLFGAPPRPFSRPLALSHLAHLPVPAC